MMQSPVVRLAVTVSPKNSANTTQKQSAHPPSLRVVQGRSQRSSFRFWICSDADVIRKGKQCESDADFPKKDDSINISIDTTKSSTRHTPHRKTTEQVQLS